MKKLFLALIMGILVVSAFTACEDEMLAKKPQNKPMYQSDVKKEIKKDTPDAELPSDANAGSAVPKDVAPKDVTAKDAVSKDTVSKDTTAPTGKAPAQNKKSDAPSFIGEARAKEIALQRAGLAANDVRFIKAELDRDNGIWHYEIEFRQGKYEYDVDVKADDGKVLSYEVDIDD